MAKDRDRSNEARLTSDKIHPIYDTKNFKQYINSEKDQIFMKQYAKGSTQDLITEMKSSCKELLYTGDKEKTEKAHIAEKAAIIRDI